MTHRQATCRRCGATVTALSNGYQGHVEREPLSAVIPLGIHDPALLFEDHPTRGWVQAPPQHRGYPIHPLHQCASTSDRRSTA